MHRRPPLLRAGYCYRMLGSGSEAEDAVRSGKLVRAAAVDGSCGDEEAAVAAGARVEAEVGAGVDADRCAVDGAFADAGAVVAGDVAWCACGAATGGRARSVRAAGAISARFNDAIAAQ